MSSQPSETEIEAAGSEHRQKHDTTDWLETHGARTWWEESNAWGHDLFTIDREGHSPLARPDMVVEFANGDTYVIEYKPGSAKGAIYAAARQIRGYLLSYLIHNEEYIVADRVVEPDGFLVATHNSRFGRLFPAFAEREQQYDDFDDGRREAVDYGVLPPREYTTTEAFSRLLWREGDELVENIDVPDRQVPPLGVLLSDHLETEQYDPSPAVLMKDAAGNQAWEVYDHER